MGFDSERGYSSAIWGDKREVEKFPQARRASCDVAPPRAPQLGTLSPEGMLGLLHLALFGYTLARDGANVKCGDS